jgi:hypothetical protein
MGNFKLTGLAAGTVAGDSARYDELILKADLISPVLVTPNLGTPSAGVLTNCTGTAAGLSIGGNAATVTTNANLTGAVTSVGNVSSLGSFTSAQLATALTNETGTGSAVFATSPTLTSPTLTSPTLTSPVIAGTPTGVGVLTSGTAQASTSGTSITFTGIPSWVKRVTVMFSGVSTNGTNPLQIQVGVGSIQTTGYVSQASSIGAGVGTNSSTVGFILTQSTAIGDLASGAIQLCLQSSTSIVATGGLNKAGAGALGVNSGLCTVSGSIDQLRIIGSTTGSPTDTFDAGSINIMYE